MSLIVWRVMNLLFSKCLILCLKLFSHMSFSRVQRIGFFFGQMLVQRDKRSVSAMEKNLQLCLPDLSEIEHRKILEDRCGFIGQTFLEMSHLWVKPAVEVRPYIQRHDNPEFEAALQEEGGVIILAPHLGNWEMLNFYVSQFRNMTVMYRPHKNPNLDQFILNARQGVGSELAPTNRKGVMQLMKALKNNGLVGILPDQVPAKGSGVFANFFELPAYTMTLAHQIVLKTQAKVFVGAAFQMQGGYDIHVVPLPEAFYQTDAVESALVLNQSIEDLIQLYPAQYQWEYKRFKRQPDGQESLYKI